MDVLEQVGEQIEELEEGLLSDPKPEKLELIHYFRSELLLLKKSIWPLREFIGDLARGESLLIQENTTPFLRDVQHDATVLDILLRDVHVVIFGVDDEVGRAAVVENPFIKSPNEIGLG